MPHDAFMVISLSGRGLVRASAHASRPVLGMDVFADQDTIASALHWVRLPVGRDWKMDAQAVLAATKSLCAENACAGLVYGSGFEGQGELLKTLSKQLPLFGNDPEVLDLVADPMGFSALLDRLQIAHPETTLNRPADPVDWLCKQAGACGGVHVRPAAECLGGTPGKYYQRHVSGPTYSLLFLANGRDISVIGFNRQLTAPTHAPGRWSYAGAVSVREADVECGSAVMDAARMLTRALNLKGLNGIDFIITTGGWCLLELNPRPTATVELWDVSPMPPLFELHLQACRGTLPDRLSCSPAYRASAVVYADRNITVPDGMVWPDWCVDRPFSNQAVQSRHPICTVLSQGDSTGSAEAEVIAKRSAMLTLMNGFSTSIPRVVSSCGETETTSTEA